MCNIDSIKILFLGNLTFSIPQGLTNDKFVIDEKRGTITTKSKLDRETRDKYIFPVYVTDASSFQTTANFDVTTVTVHLLDVNDNPPLFKPGACYPLAVPENNEVEVIHIVTATDKDIGANGVLTYSITCKLYHTYLSNKILTTYYLFN